MFISVTENVSAVTDVLSLLSSLGFDAGERDIKLELVIDNFDQWHNPASLFSYGCTTGSNMQIAA